jgi:sugar O-acyltransferase (sialic acid O-acetyltransferase NeuD family)
MNAKQIVIYGAGGFAREVAWLAEEVGYSVAAFIDDDPSHQGMRLNGFPVIGLEHGATQFNQCEIAIAVGSPSTRELLMTKSIRAGFRPSTLIHPRVERSRWIEYGEGVVICAGSILTTNITIGNHVQINLDCTVGHDVVMEDFSTLAPGAHVSGWVRLERGAYVGTGAVIINGTSTKPLVIGAGAVIGAAACVVKSVEAGAIVAGVPAKPLAVRV